MALSSPPMALAGTPAIRVNASNNSSGNEQLPRLNSRDLMQQRREIEIDHEGRIYRLRITQLNKLILTA